MSRFARPRAGRRPVFLFLFRCLLYWAAALLLGALVIHVFNTLRILTLIWVLAWRASWFDFAHVYLWQTGTVLIVFLTFALWLRAVTGRREDTGEPA